MKVQGLSILTASLVSFCRMLSFSAQRQVSASMTVFHLLYSSIQFEIPRSQKLRPKYYEGEFQWYF